MKKKHTLIVLLLSALLLSSCVKLRIETKIKKDGSGTKGFVIAIDKSIMSMMESMAEGEVNSDDLWAEVTTGAEAIPGAQVEQYSDDDSEGIRISIPFKNYDELQALSSAEAFEGTDQVTVTQDGDQVTLRAVVEAGDLTSGLDQAGGQELEGLDLSEIDIEYSYIIDVEGKIQSYGPKDIATVEGSKITWDLTQVTENAVELMVTWKPGGGGPDILIIALIVVAVLGAALVIVGVIIALRSRRTGGV